MKHWKLGVHLLFRTKRFGINNQWTSQFDSLFGVSGKQIMLDLVRVYPIIQNYRMMRFRTIECGFLPEEEARMLWPRYYEKLRHR